MIEFDYVKFPKSVSCKKAVWREFLENSSSTFSKKWVLQKREFCYPFFQSVSYKNVIVKKEIYFSSRFLKSWIDVSDVAGLVGKARSSTRGGIDIAKEKGIFSLVQ